MTPAAEVSLSAKMAVLRVALFMCAVLSTSSAFIFKGFKGPATLQDWIGGGIKKLSCTKWVAGEARPFVSKKLITQTFEDRNPWFIYVDHNDVSAPSFSAVWVNSRQLPRMIS